jgi:hemerythrin
VKGIDDQHKRLVELINELYEAMQTGKGKEILSSILERLFHYATIHFSDEEEYMRLFGSPMDKKHEEKHKDFIKKIIELQKNFNEGKAGISIEVLFYLKEWLLKHIMLEDKKFGSVDKEII